MQAAIASATTGHGSPNYTVNSTRVRLKGWIWHQMISCAAPHTI